MDFDLQKKGAIVNRILLDKGVKKSPIMRVGAALDVSGSMDGLIRRGALQNAFNQLMGVSVKFDDNGELDVFKFDHNCTYVGTSKPVKGDYDKYIDHNRIHASGGTAYKPIVDEAIDFFFEGAPHSSAPAKKGFLGGMFGSKQPEATPTTSGGGGTNDIPVLLLILTDGEPSDARETEQAMSAAQHLPIYFHMVGIGGTRRNFPTIARLADALPNVGEVYLDRLDMTDEEIYEQLICDELVEFIGKFGSTGQQQATA
jgi:hypothetical protein